MKGSKVVAGDSYLNSKLLSWVGGGWFNSVVRLRLSQPPAGDWLADRAELGNYYNYELAIKKLA